MSPNYGSQQSENKNNSIAAADSQAADVKSAFHNMQEMEVGCSENKTTEQVTDNRVLVDKLSHFESVREAVSKFGGIVDWKAHKASIMERRKNVLLELEKVQEQTPEYKRKSEAAEEAKAQVLMELDGTKRLIEELKLSVQEAETQDIQAKEDSELAELRVEEMKQGIGNNESVAAKTQLDVVKQRHTTAISDILSLKQELESLQREHAHLITERDITIEKAEESTAQSKDIEKAVDDLTLELMALKESLDSAHTAHLDAEEQRINACLAWERDKLQWQNELKQAEGELQHLNEHLLLNLKAESKTYAEGKPEEHSLVVENQKELEEVKADIEKTKDHVNCLRVAVASLQCDLEREKAELAATRREEASASFSVSALQAELERISSELAAILTRETGAGGKMDLPEELRQALKEADQAKSAAHLAQEELKKAEEESVQTKAEARAMEMRLNALVKEIEAAKASENLATEAIKALIESEEANDTRHTATLPLEEYYSLSKKAREAEELADKRVLSAIEQIKEAKELKTGSLAKLEEARKKIEERKQALSTAMDRAKKGTEAKLAVERELRKWRAEHEQRGEAVDAARGLAELSNLEEFGETDSDYGGNPHVISPRAGPTRRGAQNAVHQPMVRQSIFPRLVTFLARKKAESLT